MAITINATDVSLTTDDEGHRTYEVTFQAITDSEAIHAQQVYLAAYTAYPPYTPYVGILPGDIDSRAFARRPKSVSRPEVAKSRKKWKVLIPFSTKPLKRCADSDFENPLDEPPKISGSFFRNQIVTGMDRNGRQLMNSSNEPEFTEVDDSRDTIIIEWNTDSPHLGLRAAMRDCCNDAPIWGLGARQLALRQWAWVQEFYGTCMPFYSNRLELEVNIKGWDFVRIDQGFRIIIGVDGAGNTTYSTLMATRDQPLRKPQLLDGAGGLLAAGAAPHVLRDEVVDEADFGQLLAIGLTDPLF